MTTPPLQRLILLLLLVCGPALAGSAGAPVHAENPWIREAPPGASALAGYLTLHNTSGKDRRLLSAESPAFARVEMHRSVVENGMARMLPQESITIPAKDRVALEPGGYHLMLMQPVKALKAGDTATITLSFDSGEPLEVEMEVKKGMGEDGGHHHHHHEHEHP